MKRFQNRGCEPSIPGHPWGLLFVSPKYNRIPIDAPSLNLGVNYIGIAPKLLVDNVASQVKTKQLL